MTIGLSNRTKAHLDQFSANPNRLLTDYPEIYAGAKIGVLRNMVRPLAWMGWALKEEATRLGLTAPRVKDVMVRMSDVTIEVRGGVPTNGPFSEVFEEARRLLRMVLIEDFYGGRCQRLETWGYGDYQHEIPNHLA